MSSGEQLGAGCGAPDIDAGLMPPQPSLRDRALDAGAVFGRIAAGGEKGAIDPLNIDAVTASAALAISIGFRTAASGSLNGLGSANFTGFVLGGDVRDVDQGILEAVAIKHLAAGTAHHRLGFCEGNLSPASLSAYFLAVQSR
jgi:hypothetical protein